MTNMTIVSIESCSASMAAGRSEQSSCFSYARHHEEQFNKIKSENWNQKWDIFCCEACIQNKKVFAKTTAERNEERGNVLRHQNTFLIANNAGSGEAVTYSEPSESLLKSFSHPVKPKHSTREVFWQSVSD